MGIGFQEEKDNMRCVVCKNGKTKVGKATVTLDKGAATLSSKAFRRVSAPTAVRNMSMEKIAASLLKSAAEAARSGIQVQIRQFSAP